MTATLRKHGLHLLEGFCLSKEITTEEPEKNVPGDTEGATPATASMLVILGLSERELLTGGDSELRSVLRRRNGQSQGQQLGGWLLESS